MALTSRGQYQYGDSSEDARTYLRDYSKTAGYLAQQFAEPTCTCGHKTFLLALDEEQGVAVRTCNACQARHPVGDSAEYLSEAHLEECACPCGAEAFELTIGVSLYPESDAVRWVYIGARCAGCGLVGCYGDWKNEHEDYDAYLQQT